MDTSLLKNPGAPYDLLPSFTFILVSIIILLFWRVIRVLRISRKSRSKVIKRRSTQSEESFSNWLRFCHLAHRYILAYKENQRQNTLYKALILCISCRAKSNLLSRTPLSRGFPLLSKDESKLLTLLYFAIYSGVKLPEKYLSELINILKRLQCY